MIAPGTILTADSDGDAIEFVNFVNDEPVHIRVKPLFRLVERAWKAFDKATLKARRSKEPKGPVYFSGRTFEVPPASSGCNIMPKAVKMQPKAGRNIRFRRSLQSGHTSRSADAVSNWPALSAWCACRADVLLEFANDVPTA